MLFCFPIQKRENPFQMPKRIMPASLRSKNLLHRPNKKGPIRSENRRGGGLKDTTKGEKGIGEKIAHHRGENPNQGKKGYISQNIITKKSGSFDFWGYVFFFFLNMCGKKSIKQK